jgi:probable phosphoglycerate mutase
MRLCLVRHGETAWNVEHRLQGWTDIPLNAHGERQAQAVARALAGVHFDAIVSSPLQRAWATAQAVAAGRPVAQEPRLRERHHGDLQGMTRTDIAAAYPSMAEALQAHRPDFLPPGGESIEGFAARVHAALSDLSQRHAGRTVLAVAHGGVLDVAYRLATGQDLLSPRRQALPNAALNWLLADYQGWRVEAFGLTSHLDAALDDQGG